MGQQKNQPNHKKTPKLTTDQPNTSTFSDHIRELRRRSLWIALVFVIVSAIAYNYHDQLVQIVMAPLQGQKLIYLTPGGGFSFIFQITLYAGIIAAAPMLTYQLYAFVRPTLPPYAKRSAVKVALSATLLMIMGVAYGYFIAVPAALTFLANFAGTEILPSLTADSYLSFFLSYVGGLALLFQLPLLLIFWHWIKPMKPGGLLKSERFVIVFAFVAAALITPTPDIINQAMIAGPLIGLYQLGVLVVLSSILRERRQHVQPVLPSSAVQATMTPKATLKPSVVNPAVQTSQQLLKQQLSPVKTPRPVQTSIDGFKQPSTTTPHTRQSQPRRPLAVPRRPSFINQASPRLSRRPRLSIDGISPA